MSISPRLIAALVLVAAVVAFRLLPIYGGQELSKALANVSPLAALALCGGMLLPRRLAIGVTFGAFLLSDIALNLFYRQPILNTYSLVLLAAFAGVFAVGWLLRMRPGWVSVLGGALAGTMLFYVVSNTAAFFYDPGYAKTIAGWWQALTIGLPIYPPTWSFGLRSLAGNLVFAALFFVAIRPVRTPVKEWSPAISPSS